VLSSTPFPGLITVFPARLVGTLGAVLVPTSLGCLAGALPMFTIGFPRAVPMLRR